MSEEEKHAKLGSFRMEVLGRHVGTLERVCGRGEETHMPLCDASWDNHSASHKGKWFHELDGLPGLLCLRLDVCEKSSNRVSSYSDEALACQLSSDGYVVRPSSMENEYWLFQIGKPEMEANVEENLVDLFASMLTKNLENEKNIRVCTCHVSWEDFGFCCQINDQCTTELGVESAMDKRSTGPKDDLYIVSALKEMDKTINGAAQTNCSKHNMTLLRLSRLDEPPDVG